MRQQSRWARRLMKCPEGRGESELFVEWRLELEMNDKAMETFQEQGGTKLIGTNLFDCHPEPARSKLKGLMETQKANVYTVEKNGKRKFIYQTPWYRGEKYCGFVELILEIPAQLPHFVRNG